MNAVHSHPLAFLWRPCGSWWAWAGSRSFGALGAVCFALFTGWRSGRWRWCARVAGRGRVRGMLVWRGWGQLLLFLLLLDRRIICKEGLKGHGVLLKLLFFFLFGQRVLWCHGSPWKHKSNDEECAKNGMASKNLVSNSCLSKKKNNFVVNRLKFCALRFFRFRFLAIWFVCVFSHNTDLWGIWLLCFSVPLNLGVLLHCLWLLLSKYFPACSNHASPSGSDWTKRIRPGISEHPSQISTTSYFGQ